MSLCTSIPATRSYRTFTRPPPAAATPRDETRAARQGPGQYRRLTYAHEDAAVVTRQRGPPVPLFLTATTGPKAIGHDGRRNRHTMRLPARPPPPQPRKTPSPHQPASPQTAGRDPGFIRHGRTTTGSMRFFLEPGRNGA